MKKKSSEGGAGMGKTKRREFYRGEKVTLFDIKDGDSSIEFNWVGLGCPKEMCCQLGDKVISVDFPEGFPENKLQYRNERIVVYNVKQELHMTSEANRVPTNVLITVSTSKISVPFQLKLGDDQLLGTLTLNDREPVYDGEGNLLWYIVYPDWTDFEKTVMHGGPCRPNCRWTSVLQSKLEYPWKEEYADIGDEFIIQHYKRRVDYNWASYHCENGKWKFKRNDVDTQIEKKPVRKKLY